MYVVCVNVFVTPGHEQEFIQAVEKNHLGTVREPGALRFDVLQAADDPTRFVLYEVYQDEAAFRAHQQTGHYLTWKQTVADWMAQPRQAIKCNSVFPASEDQAWRGSF
jgi:autoinducer 2-degrading protein